MTLINKNNRTISEIQPKIDFRKANRFNWRSNMKEDKQKMSNEYDFLIREEAKAPTKE